MYKKREKCAICDNAELSTILDYGRVPLAGYFPSKEEIEKEELFDLNILFCDSCSLVQTDSIIDPDHLFKDYRYMSSFGLSKHFTEVANKLKDRFNLKPSSVVVEIGSNDGVLQKPLMDLGITAIGFEPANNIAKVARDKGCHVINDYFSIDNVDRYLAEDSVDLVISNNCFAHIEDIMSVAKGIKHILKDGGDFVFEVSYVRDLIEKLQYDNIYHEHIYYYSLNALDIMFKTLGMAVVDFELIPIHCGSIRVYVKNINGVSPGKVYNFLDRERSIGLTSLPWYKAFGQRVQDHINKSKAHLEALKQSGAKIVGYGASGRANMICNALDLGPDTISYIVDESPEKAGRFIAGKKIPIVGKDVLDNDAPDYVLIFAHNFFDMIKGKLEGRGLKFINLFSEVESLV